MSAELTQMERNALGHALSTDSVLFHVTHDGPVASAVEDILDARLASRSSTSRGALREQLSKHFVMHHDVEGRIGGEWRCACGLKFGFSDSAIDHQASAIDETINLREPHAYVIEMLVNADSFSEHWIVYNGDEFTRSDDRDDAERELTMLVGEDGYSSDHVRIAGLVTR